MVPILLQPPHQVRQRVLVAPLVPSQLVQGAVASQFLEPQELPQPAFQKENKFELELEQPCHPQRSVNHLPCEGQIPLLELELSEPQLVEHSRVAGLQPQSELEPMYRLFHRLRQACAIPFRV